MTDRVRWSRPATIAAGSPIVSLGWGSISQRIASEYCHRADPTS